MHLSSGTEEQFSGFQHGKGPPLHHETDHMFFGVLGGELQVLWELWKTWGLRVQTMEPNTSSLLKRKYITTQSYIIFEKYLTQMM
jgi:hypothetical protein